MTGTDGGERIEKLDFVTLDRIRESIGELDLNLLVWDEMVPPGEVAVVAIGAREALLILTTRAVDDLRVDAQLLSDGRSESDLVRGRRETRLLGHPLAWASDWSAERRARVSKELHAVSRRQVH